MIARCRSEAKKLVGWNVRRLWGAKGWTIEDLADKAGSDASFVARLERGQVNAGIVILEQLAKSFTVKLAELTIEPAPAAQAPKPLSAGRKPTKIKQR